jgi:uncharacterized protein YdhG (YjbR/CyaY superfamily)
VHRTRFSFRATTPRNHPARVALRHSPSYLSAESMAKTTTVVDYIGKAPPVARRALKQLRTAIKAAAPGITERISYGVPTFDLDGRYLLYIAAFKQHVGVYPITPGMLAKYGKVIAPYRSGKGTLRFPLDSPIPADLVAKLAKVRVRERRASVRESGRSAAGSSS